MRRSKPVAIGLLASVFAALSAGGQVMTVFDIKDPAARRLQQQYMQQLQQIAADIQGREFPYRFYLSRQLDIDEPQQLRVSQSSIRFDKYNGQMALEITGNYYASYSDELMNKSKRVRKSFEDVILPILKAAVPAFPDDDSFAVFAIEIAHHVRHKIAGIRTENAENVVFILPRAAAHRLVTATSPEQQQAAALDGEVYVDSEPIALWLTGEEPPPIMAREKPAKRDQRDARVEEVASMAKPPAAPDPSVSPALMKPSDWPVRLIMPDTLKTLRTSHQVTIERMVRALDSQAHFVAYAPPTFVAFHQGAYLQLSITTPLAATAGSRYQLAALAFDDHISHLIRPVLAYFQHETSFEGVSFSTTLKPPGGSSSEAVEFFFPFKIMQCFATYDCTGQQLLDAGIVLINGERAALNLQVAEKR
jgi:hypothetical protein